MLCLELKVDEVLHVGEAKIKFARISKTRKVRLAIDAPEHVVIEIERPKEGSCSPEE